MENTDRFFNKLEAFSVFEEFTDPNHYQELPADWIIFVSDIKGSTKAIEAGKYKEVNLIGAASITTVIKALKGIDFPFVFGGDGSSLCVPHDKASIVAEELGKLVNMSQENYDLLLRVAQIPAKDVMESGKKIFVSKFEITQGRSIALFRGGGLGYADYLAKDHYEKYKINIPAVMTAELEGVSCRWNPIPPQKEKVLSLLVMAQEDNETSNKAYAEVVDGIITILNSGIEDANPIKSTKKKYNGFLESVINESKMHDTLISFSFFKRFLEIMLAVLIFKLGINPIFFALNRKGYEKDMATHSDFRKFDDTLRLILDCTETQIQELKDFLESAYQQGKIFYGMFDSDHALMTCFVEDLGQGGHLHFVDGGDGGFAMAAKGLKAQIKDKNA